MRDAAPSTWISMTFIYRLGQSQGNRASRYSLHLEMLWTGSFRTFSIGTDDALVPTERDGETAVRRDSSTLHTHRTFIPILN
jgi:hypothetical protein